MARFRFLSLAASLLCCSLGRAGDPIDAVRDRIMKRVDASIEESHKRIVDDLRLILRDALAGQEKGGGFSAVIDHPFFPISKVRRTVLERHGKKLTQIVRRVEDKTKKIGGVECAVLVEEESYGGEMREVSRNYYAQKDGAVWCFGEEVENYKGGEVKDTKGTWVVGKGVEKPFVFLPAKMKKGDSWKPEIVPDIADETLTVHATDETVEIEGFAYVGVLKLLEEDPINKEVETLYFAKGVGLVRMVEGKHTTDLTEVGAAKK